MKNESENPYAAPQAADALHADDGAWDERCERIADVVRRSDVSVYLAALYGGVYATMILIAGISLFSLGLFGPLEGTVIAVSFLLPLVASYLLFTVALALRRLRMQPSVRALNQVLATHKRLFVFGSVVTGLWACLTVLNVVLQWVARPQ
jgi:hypothetical protein